MQSCALFTWPPICGQYATFCQAGREAGGELVELERQRPVRSDYCQLRPESTGCSRQQLIDRSLHGEKPVRVLSMTLTLSL